MRAGRARRVLSFLFNVLLLLFSLSPGRVPNSPHRFIALLFYDRSCCRKLREIESRASRSTERAAKRAAIATKIVAGRGGMVIVFFATVVLRSRHVAADLLRE